MTLTSQQSSQLTLTTWIAPNPFGDPTAFALVHPSTPADVSAATEAISSLGLKRLDEGGDILPIGTDTLFASLRAMRVELCSHSGVWCEQSVTDEWTSAAISRRYIVLAVGTELLAEEPTAEDIARYIRQHETVYTALVKIRVRIEQG